MVEHRPSELCVCGHQMGHHGPQWYGCYECECNVGSREKEQQSSNQEVVRINIRGDGSFSREPDGQWVAAKHYDEALAEIKRLIRERDGLINQMNLNTEISSKELRGCHDELRRLRAALEQIVREYEPGYSGWDFVGIAKQALRQHLWSNSVPNLCVICQLPKPENYGTPVTGECGRPADETDAPPVPDEVDKLYIAAAKENARFRAALEEIASGDVLPRETARAALQPENGEGSL